MARSWKCTAITAERDAASLIQIKAASHQPREYRFMTKDRTVKDLIILSAIKLAVIVTIYYACFAAYDGRPVDTVSHLLGPSGPTPQSNAEPGLVN